MNKNTIKNITNLSSKMPKTLNEALNFNGGQAYEGDDMNTSEPEISSPEINNDIAAPEEEQLGINPASEKAKKLIDDIRKMSLRAMAELADTPEDENYIMLKKVWSMTDRKPEQDKNNAQN